MSANNPRARAYCRSVNIKAQMHRERRETLRKVEGLSERMDALEKKVEEILKAVTT